MRRGSGKAEARPNGEGELARTLPFGKNVGSSVGPCVGSSVGEAVGDGVGSDVGAGVGEAVGDGVGSGVGLNANSQNPHSQMRLDACRELAS